MYRRGAGPRTANKRKTALAAGAGEGLGTVLFFEERRFFRTTRGGGFGAAESRRILTRLS